MKEEKDIIQSFIKLGCRCSNNGYHLYDIQKWLREVKNIHISVFCDYDVVDKSYNTSWNVNVINLSYGDDKEHRVERFIRNYNEIYEEALEAGILEAYYLLNN